MCRFRPTQNPVLAFLLGILWVLSMSPAWADPLPQPVGRVILTISGDIGNSNGNGKAEFDRAMLEQLGMHELRTHTAWTQGQSVFEGILVSALLDKVDAKGTIGEARAINDYAVEFPLAEFKKYPILLAMKLDGKYMRIRNKGPLWVIFPWDEYPELNTEQNKHKSIWQLKSIHIR